MSEKLTEYRQARAPLPDRNLVWPLYGAGLENLGRDDKPIDAPLPKIGPNQLLVRHDACGICFSDIKVIKLGQDHPRVYREMKTSPVILGHEVAMTVVQVGENLRDRYQVGERFIIQADIYVGGVGYAYGYEMEGGFSWYGLIDERVLNGDEGNYLLPIQMDKGYAESALTEPWACVIAAYRLEYRTSLKPGGITWIIGASPDDPRPYTLSAGFDEQSHPAKLLLSRVPRALADELKTRAGALGVEVVEVDDISQPPVEQVDDIVLLGADPDAIEIASPRLANFGVFAIVADQPMPRKVQIDIGRVHYNRWVYVGGTTPDIAQAYSQRPVRAEMKAGGRTWMVGAAGPMGRMHVQRAVQAANGPSLLVCTDVSQHRLDDLYNTFGAEAEAKGIQFVCLNPTTPEGRETLAAFQQDKFDDVVVMVPAAAIIADCADYLLPDGVMNVFAGVARGVMIGVDVSDFYLRNVRYIGQSGSTIFDLRTMLEQGESGVLSRNRTVAAIGSLSAFKDGLRAVQDTVFPGKVVIFPHIKDMPLTPIEDLKDTLPTVYALLKDGHEWTVEAEDEFLKIMLP